MIQGQKRRKAEDAALPTPPWTTAFLQDAGPQQFPLLLSPGDGTSFPLFLSPGSFYIHHGFLEPSLLFEKWSLLVLILGLSNEGVSPKTYTCSLPLPTPNPAPKHTHSQCHAPKAGAGTGETACVPRPCPGELWTPSSTSCLQARLIVTSCRFSLLKSLSFTQLPFSASVLL